MGLRSIGSELFTVVGGRYNISISAKEIIEDLKEYFSEEYRK